MARFLVDPVWWLYITWLPLFLYKVHGFDLKQIGLFAWVPYVAADPGGRVIVKYKATDAALKQALAADRTDRLSARIGVRLVRGNMLHERAEVVTASGVDSDELARRLSAQADVEYAVPDRRRTIRALPNDPLHATQWYHQPITAAPAAIDAVTAWDSTTGDASIVVAFVDTGVRYDHPDLANRLLPGYDFISDRVNAGDGDSRDADASMPAISFLPPTWPTRR